MDSWPRDDRESTNSASIQARKRKKTEHVVNGFPNLRQGMVGAATLRLKKDPGRFEWTFLQDCPSRTWKLEEALDVFPNTRAPALPKLNYTTTHKGEQAANFLRTHLPDVEVPSEFIRDLIMEETTLADKLDQFDPYSGNLLVTLPNHAVSRGTTGYLAFAMGEALTDLNISRYEVHQQKGLKIIPEAEAKVFYKTPIQQVVGTSTADESFLAVRTFADTNILKLRRPGSSRLPETLARLTKQNTGNRDAMDVKLRSSDVVIVDDVGGIHITDFSISKSATTSRNPCEDWASNEAFGRLALGAESLNGFLVSSKQLYAFDWRAPDIHLQWTLPHSSDCITSIEDCRKDNLVRLCSTGHLIWLDQRNMRRPLLSMLHYREVDRSLCTATLGMSSPVTFLSTRRNSLISLFDASCGEDKLFHVQGSPYGLFPKNELRNSIGQAIITSPFEPEPSNFVFLRLSERGGLVGHSVISSLDSGFSAKVTLSDEMRDLKSTTGSLVADVGPLGERENSEVNMFPAYDKAFREYNEQLEKFEEAEVEAVYNLLDAIPSYFQRPEGSGEQILTTYDVAFRAGEEPKSTSRSDFLTGSILNSLRGYRALQQGRLDSEPLKSASAWYMNLDNVLQHIDPSVASDLDPDSLSVYDLQDDEHRPIQSLRLEKKAREQLAVDLALSRDVYSLHPLVATSADVDHTLETMTEALTLGDEPPAVEFSYLKPVLKGHYKESSGTQHCGVGMGVRELLKEWEPGTTADKYEYRDPYNTSDSVPFGHAGKLAQDLSKINVELPIPASIQRPPTIVITAKPNPSKGASQPRASPMKAGTSQQLERLWMMPTQTQQSQDVMPSTQILPGPFGGRPTKKKSAKKRVGGF